MDQHPKLMVITGAGISADSGIPTYRDNNGLWKHSQPIQHQAYIDDLSQRQRYWARSAVGWPTIAQATPNPTHYALVELEKMGRISLLVTQNVDRLHQKAGHNNVIDLHGRLDQVICLQCGQVEKRSLVQLRLIQQNNLLSGAAGISLPDGDADIADNIIKTIHCPECQWCKSTLMPDVVFFGGTVPKTRVNDCMSALKNSDALLVIGSSLMVYSSFRFCRDARKLSKPIAVINQGKTRADDILQLKIKEDCSALLRRITEQL